jgi:ABC-2 type transport system permease protein
MVQLRTSIASAMAYRANFIIEGVLTLAWLALTLVPLLVLFAGRETVAGWDAPSALIVIAYFTAVRAVLEGVVSPSIIELVSRIRSGAFDYVLLKPVDAQFQISASHYEPWKILDLLAAIVLAVVAFERRGYGPDAGDVALGIVMLGVGVAAMYSLYISCAAAAFWVVRLDNLVFLLGAIFDIARWPIQVLPGLWRILFTFIIPVALMTTFPAMALLGRLDARTALVAIGGALGLVIVSRLLWRAAIRNYTSASS